MNDKVRLIGNLLEDKLAEDVEVFELGNKHPLFDNVIVASVQVSRNLEGIINEIKKYEKEGKIEVKQYDINNPEWILIDCYDLLVHVFVKEMRTFYDIDSILRNYEA
ncbi:MAG: ribosome silencing factor [Bacilli bacterium]|jgi:ribosome silencing factor RsfS/YbeB/iojap|nr:ribosome silencing factor [Bacilli bacterium]